MILNSTTSNLKGNAYAIDWLKVIVKVNHDQHSLNDGIRVDIRKNKDGYDTERQHESFRPLWLENTGSYFSQLKVKSLSESSLQIEGNFFKWLYGHNITGTTDLIRLVFDVVNSLAMNGYGVEPTEQQLDAIKQGLFKVHVIDINKALLFEDKESSLKYLEQLKYVSSYPYRKKDIESNGVYFGKASKRWVLKYYHKGSEVVANKKHQLSITPELKALSELMIRCEMRIKWHQLNDWDLLVGENWNDETVRKLVDDAHSKLRMPEPMPLPDMPKKYIKFLACFTSGTVFDCYSDKTIKRMSKDLIRLYGITPTDYCDYKHSKLY